MIYGLFIGGPVRSFFEFHYLELTDARSGRRWSLTEGEQSDPSLVRYIMYKVLIFSQLDSVRPVLRRGSSLLEILRLICNFVNARAFC